MPEMSMFGSRGACWSRPLLGLALGALVLVVAAPEATAESASQGATRAGGGKRNKRAARALQNMLEAPSFPHEQVEAPQLIKPKFTPGPRARKPTAAAVTASTTGLPAPSEPVTAGKPAEAPGKPGKIEVTAPPIPENEPAKVAPAAPAAPPKPSLSAETGTQIDSILGKAFVPPPPEAPAAGGGGAASSGQMNADEIATGMKPVRAAVKKSCTFGQRGVVVVRVEVGPGGNVRGVTPEGPLATRPATKCVVDAVKSARFPASAGASFRYPFPVR